jgi:toxin ParE1/3/4
VRGVRWADQALKDLLRIYEFYASTAPHFPPALIDRLVPLLLAFPAIGALAEDVPFRKFRLGGTDFILFYRATEDGVEIARLFHARQDLRG